MNDRALRKLLAITDVSRLGINKTIHAMGRLIDLAEDLNRTEALRHAISVLTTAAKIPLADKQTAMLHYYLGNARAITRRLSRRGNDSAWDWQQQDFEQEIVALRLASRAGDKAELSPVVLCRIRTNLANALSYVGRFVEAISQWDKTLELDRNFAMALGNKGYGLAHYARAVYDQGHAIVLLKRAHDYLQVASRGALEGGARDALQAELTAIRKILPADYLNRPFKPEEFSLGRSRAEKSYRLWCLQQRLFLNPLNDLGPYTIAAQDILHLPTMVVPIDEGPKYIAFFSQLKQEYASARYVFYEGATADRPHFSDRRVLQFDTLDYPCYALCIERQKFALRAAYSIFDKIAFFLNEYLKLGIKPNRVTFRTLWYTDGDKKKGLRRIFAHMKNWPLRGLFWLSKDLYEDTPGFRQSLEPAAEKLAAIRNHIEHKYLKVHDEMWQGPPSPEEPWRLPITDTLAFSVFRHELEECSLLTLRLARAALVYLSLGVHAEEQVRAHDRDPSERIAASPMFTWEDRFKR